MTQCHTLLLLIDPSFLEVLKLLLQQSLYVVMLDNETKIRCFLLAKTASSTVGVVNDSLWQLPTTTFPFPDQNLRSPSRFLMVWKTDLEQIQLWGNLVILCRLVRLISFMMTSTKTILTIAIAQVVFIHWISYIKENCTAQPSFARAIYSHTEISSDTKFLQRVNLMRKKSLWLDYNACLNMVDKWGILAYFL